MTALAVALLQFLSRHCRGPAAARKVWKIADDLCALGLDIDPEAVLDAAADLGRQGFPVIVTAGDLPAIYIGERPSDRGRADWWARRRPRRPVRPLSRRPVDLALTHAEAVCGQRAKATSSGRSEEGCHAS